MQQFIDAGKRSAKDCLSDDDYKQAAHWLPVCPVHLIADRDTLLLAPPQALQLSLAQAQSLVDTFNQHFKEDGYRLISVSEWHWFLGSSHPWQLGFPSLADAVSLNLRDAWQQGDDASQWRKLLNEAQMLWYAHPVNEQLEGQGRLIVNGFWSLARKPWWCFW
jgi:hypothetical protein